MHNRVKIFMNLYFCENLSFSPVYKKIGTMRTKIRLVRSLRNNSKKSRRPLSSVMFSGTEFISTLDQTNKHFIKMTVDKQFGPIKKYCKRRRQRLVFFFSDLLIAAWLNSQANARVPIKVSEPQIQQSIKQTNKQTNNSSLKFNFIKNLAPLRNNANEEEDG